MSEFVLRWTIGRSQSPSPQWSIYISEAEKIAQEIFHVEQVEFLDWEMTAGARARVRMWGGQQNALDQRSGQTNQSLEAGYLGNLNR